MENKVVFTTEWMLENGWVKTNDPISNFEKELPNNNPINTDPEDTGIKLIVHSTFNKAQFAILLPDGGMLNFTANSIEELQAFEKAIDFYDCPY